MDRRLPLVLTVLLLAGCGIGTRSRDIAGAGEEHERFDQPDAAQEYFAMKRAAHGADPRVLYAKAEAGMQRMMRYETEGDRLLGPPASRLAVNEVSGSAVGTWSFLGPGNIGGRTRALVFDPADPQVMYAGGTSGGVWKTVNGGDQWTAIGDELANLAVNSLAIDPHDRSTLYAGTGEGYFREDVRGTALPIRGNGIFVTHDAGGTWNRLEATGGDDFLWVNDLVVSSRDSRRIYAATRTGVWRSLDAGGTWSNVQPVTVKGGCLDLAFRGGTTGDFLFASCGTFEQATVYQNKTAEQGGAWTAVLSEPGMGRTSLAISPSQPNIIYALATSNDSGPGGNYSQALLGVYRSDQNGDAGTWTARLRNTGADELSTLILTNPIPVMGNRCTPPLAGNPSYTPMGWHCNVIAVDPVNPDRVWAAGVDLFRSDDGGRSWGVASYWWTTAQMPSFVHADQHVIAFHPQYDGSSNRTLYATNDGGVYRTDNATAPVGRGLAGVCDPAQSQVVFRSLNHNYGVTQFYHGQPFPDGRGFFGGAQDNGTLIGTLDGGADGWRLANGGDGAYVAVDPTNQRVLYAEAQFGSIARSADGGQHFTRAVTGISDGGMLFVTPFLIDPNQHDRLWTGGRRMWRSDDGARTWLAASQNLPSGSVSGLAVAPGRANRAVAGTSTGDVVRTDNGTSANGATAWSRAHPRDGYVSSVAFDPSNADVVYATYAGFGGAHVWRSIDGGATWTAIDGTGSATVPDIPVHVVTVDPTRAGRLYLGTDLGIFASIDGGDHWLVENSGFLNAITESVVIGQGARGPAVYAFTHGRGAWRAELTPARKRRIAKP